VEWTRSHPERRQTNRQKWSYQDWGIFLADAAASGDWTHFYAIFGIEEMTPRIVTFNLIDIIFDLLAPHQCYWAWKDSQLPVIGDLTEFRLHKHTLPLYLITRDAYRAKRGQPPKWVNLNTASLSMLPVGSTWKMLKRFCFTTYDKYAHGRNRAKGDGDPLCSVCYTEDSLLHILCECNRINLHTIRSQALGAMKSLLEEWQRDTISPMEQAMWTRYLSNVTSSNLYDEECWLSVHTDASIQWLFEEDFLTSAITIGDRTKLLKRWKLMMRLRRKYAEQLILDQQQYVGTLKIQRQSPTGQHTTSNNTPSKASRTSFLPLLTIPLRGNFDRPQRRRKRKLRETRAVPTFIFPMEDKQKKRRKKKRKINPLTNYYHPVKKPGMAQTPLADTASPDRYVNRSFGSANILDPPE
jgi:hypothetical protein